MARTYPPIWCHNEDCMKCNLHECNSKILRLFDPYRYAELDFKKRPKTVEITSIAIYFGFCQRLAKFLLLFPQDAPTPVIRSNFRNSMTGLPTEVSIQRILLDMLNHGDQGAPTDEVHRLRLMLLQDMTKSKEAFISVDGKQCEVRMSPEEKQLFVEKAGRWTRELHAGSISFDKTANPNHCAHCFLTDCDRARVHQVE